MKINKKCVWTMITKNKCIGKLTKNFLCKLLYCKKLLTKYWGSFVFGYNHYHKDTQYFVFVLFVRCGFNFHFKRVRIHFYLRATRFSVCMGSSCCFDSIFGVLFWLIRKQKERYCMSFSQTIEKSSCVTQRTKTRACRCVHTESTRSKKHRKRMKEITSIFA